VRPKVAAIKVSDCRLIPVICMVVRAGGRLLRRARSDGLQHFGFSTGDRSALHGALAGVDTLGLDLLKVRQLTPTANRQNQATVAHLDGY
jgi:hypothetical protein